MKVMAIHEIQPDGTLHIRVKEGKNINRVFVLGEDHYGDMFYPDSEFESDKKVIKAVKELLVRFKTEWGEACETNMESIVDWNDTLHNIAEELKNDRKTV